MRGQNHEAFVLNGNHIAHVEITTYRKEVRRATIAASFDSGKETLYHALDGDRVAILESLTDEDAVGSMEAEQAVELKVLRTEPLTEESARRELPDGELGSHVMWGPNNYGSEYTVEAALSGEMEQHVHRIYLKDLEELPEAIVNELRRIEANK